MTPHEFQQLVASDPYLSQAIGAADRPARTAWERLAELIAAKESDE